MLRALKRMQAEVDRHGLSKAMSNTSAKIYREISERLPGYSHQNKTYIQYARDSQYPLHVRCGTVDYSIFNCIFNEDEYSSVANIQDVRFIVDCGANVGYSAAYFLTRFPQAKVFAIEPDSNNYSMLERNVAPFGDRVKLFHAGIWPQSIGLKVLRGTYKSGSEASTQVRECLPGETADVDAVDIGTLLKMSGFDQIDILKIDIERSEVEVFARNYKEWLAKTKNIIIELHDSECEEVFHRAIADESFEFTKSHDILICRRVNS